MKQVIVNCPTFNKWRKLEESFPFAPINSPNERVVRIRLEWEGDENNSAEYLRDLVLIDDAIKYFKINAKELFD